MKTTQAWAWLAAGVLALGLNGFYQDGGAAWAHRIVDGAIEQVASRSGTLVDLASAAHTRGEDLHRWPGRYLSFSRSGDD